MYAILEIGGKQYRIEKGMKLLVDHLKTENDVVEFNSVTLLKKDKEIKIGTPFLENVIVKGRVTNPMVKGEKLIVYKYKAKSNYRRKKGFRPIYTEIEITDVEEK